MAVGNSTTQSLADSIETTIAAARIIREQASVMTSSVDRVTLARNTGTVWNEISLSALTAQAVTENTELDNPQQLADTLFSVTPTVVGIQTLITDRVRLRISAKSFARTGVLAQNAVERKKEEDGLAVVAASANDFGAAGAALVTADIRGARYFISSNTTEPAPPNGPYVGVFHGFAIQDIETDILAPTAAEVVTMTSVYQTNVYQNGFRGMVGGVMIKESGNASIDASDDSTGGVFHKEGIVLVQGRSPYVKTRDEPHIGGGATSLFHYDEYAYGERSSGNWLVGITVDTSAPS